MAKTRLSPAQTRLMWIAEKLGFVRVCTANDQRTAKSLIRRGLLEFHPDYPLGDIYRLTRREGNG